MNPILSQRSPSTIVMLFIMHTCIISLCYKQMAYKLCKSYGTRVTCIEQALYSAQTMHTLKTVLSPEHCGGVVTQSAEPTHCNMSTTRLKRDLGTGDLCDNIGLVGVSRCST